MIYDKHNMSHNNNRLLWLLAAVAGCCLLLRHINNYRRAAALATRLPNLRIIQKNDIIQKQW